VNKVCLSPEEVLSGYDVLSEVYPYVISLCIWRAWEYAAYKRYSLREPIIDVGCGDGRFFQLIWPHHHEVYGVEIDPEVANLARDSGVYREVYTTAAHGLPNTGTAYASAFANCSLEHMDHLEEVLASISRSLNPGGVFLLSVVTPEIIEWTPLPLILTKMGEQKLAESCKEQYLSYHHLVNTLTVSDWRSSLEKAGFEVLEWIPIMPEMISRFFLFCDQLWHVKTADSELGDAIFPHLRTIPNFSAGLRQVFSGLLQMERDCPTGSGAVFWAQKRRH
jgi:SAM-dependent methyltransferase